MKREFLRALPAFFAIAILVCAPALGIFSFQLLVDFGLRQGIQPGLSLHITALFGALWEIILLFTVTKDLLKD